MALSEILLYSNLAHHRTYCISKCIQNIPRLIPILIRAASSSHKLLFQRTEQLKITFGPNFQSHFHAKDFIPALSICTDYRVI